MLFRQGIELERELDARLASVAVPIPDALLAPQARRCTAVDVRSLRAIIRPRGRRNPSNRRELSWRLAN
jgi:hypothetical protein